MPFDFRPLPALPDVVLVVPKVFRDERGSVFVPYARSEFEAAGIRDAFVQDLVSRSLRRGTLRGLHYQDAPAAQAKLVRVTRGEVLDVAVDIRRGSPTFGRSASAVLTAENAHALYLPVGFAHGFCTLTDDVEMHYKLGHEYSPAHEGVIRWDDPALGIAWPTDRPILAEKDAGAPTLAEAQTRFRYE